MSLLTFSVIFHETNPVWLSDDSINNESCIEKIKKAISDAYNSTFKDPICPTSFPEINMDMFSHTIIIIEEEESPVLKSATQDMIMGLGGYKRIKTDTKDECSICLDTYVVNEGVRDLKCNHRFHKKCIDKWFKRSLNCPVCRTDAFS